MDEVGTRCLMRVCVDEPLKRSVVDGWDANKNAGSSTAESFPYRSPTNIGLYSTARRTFVQTLIRKLTSMARSNDPHHFLTAGFFQKYCFPPPAVLAPLTLLQNGSNAATRDRSRSSSGE